MLCCDITYHLAGHYKLFVLLYQPIFVIPMYTIFFVSTYLCSLISLGRNSISLCLYICVNVPSHLMSTFSLSSLCLNIFVFMHITLFFCRHTHFCSWPVCRCRPFVSASSATARHEVKWSCDVHASTVLVLVFAVIRSLTESLRISVHARTVFTPSAVGLLFYHEICD